MIGISKICFGGTMQLILPIFLTLSFVGTSWAQKVKPKAAKSKLADSMRISDVNLNLLKTPGTSIILGQDFIVDETVFLTGSLFKVVSAVKNDKIIFANSRSEGSSTYTPGERWDIEARYKGRTPNEPNEMLNIKCSKVVSGSIWTCSPRISFYDGKFQIYR